VGPAAGLSEGPGTGSDALLAVVPTSQPLTGVYAPVSDQPFLTIGSIAGGVVNFSFTANTSGSPRTAHITVLGQQIAVTQGAALLSQTITFGALADRALNGSPFTVSASASSGLAVSFGSTTTGVCTVSGNTVTLVATGTCSIQATQAGNATYAAATPVTQSFNVTAATTLSIGGQVTLSSNGLTGVTMTLSGSASATTTTNSSGNYSFTGLAPGGNYTVTPSMAGDAFSPQNAAFTSLATNQTANFTAAASVGTLTALTTAAGSSTAANLNAAPTTLSAAAPFSIPVSIALSNGATVDALTFGVQITPNGGAPAFTGSLHFSTASQITDTPVASSGGTANSLGVVWSSFTTPLAAGTQTLGEITGSIPAGAQVGQSYTITVTGVSATNGGGAQIPVAVSIGANGTLSVALTYEEGDVSSYNSDTVPNFGDGVLDIRDLIQELFAVNNIPGFKPAACSDRYDAMDLYPADTSAVRGGDNTLDIRDLILELFRVNNLDPARPVRASRGGVCATGNSIAVPEAPGPMDREARPARAADGSLALGDPESAGGGQVRVPVYLTAAQDLADVSLTFGLGDLQSPLRFVSTPAAAPALIHDSDAGIVAVVWQGGLTVPAGQRLLLGYVVGPSSAMGDVRLFGVSAAGGGRALRLESLIGANR